MSLLTGKLHEEKKTENLKIFTAGYVGKFRNLAGNIDGAVGSDFYSRITNDVDIPSSDIQKYLLATSDFSKGMQNEINHYLTRNRLNNAKLDPIAKNIFRCQNPFELVFEDILTFEVQNTIVGLLLRELVIRKKDSVSELIKKTPRPGVDLDVQKWLEALQKDNNKFDDSNNNGPPLPLTNLPTLNNLVPLPFPLLPPPPQTFKCIHHHYLHPLYCHCRGKY